MADATILAVSAAIRRGDRFLLVRRGREPARGLFAFPGGRIEAGESAEDAVRRELMEETGTEAGALAFLREIQLGGGPGKALYVLRVYHGLHAGGEPGPGDDADLAGWYGLAEMASLPMTPSTLAIARELSEGSDVPL